MGTRLFSISHQRFNGGKWLSGREKDDINERRVIILMGGVKVQVSKAKMIEFYWLEGLFSKFRGVLGLKIP